MQDHTAFKNILLLRKYDGMFCNIFIIKNFSTLLQLVMIGLIQSPLGVDWSCSGTSYRVITVTSLQDQLHQ